MRDTRSWPCHKFRSLLSANFLNFRRRESHKFSESSASSPRSPWTFISDQDQTCDFSVAALKTWLKSARHLIPMAAGNCISSGGLDPPGIVPGTACPISTINIRYQNFRHTDLVRDLHVYFAPNGSKSSAAWAVIPVEFGPIVPSNSTGRNAVCHTSISAHRLIQCAWKATFESFCDVEPWRHRLLGRVPGPFS
jgi:hypothetical protein